jgi:raffinose/stachyose/melibiose transport system permease protein
MSKKTKTLAAKRKSGVAKAATIFLLPVAILLVVYVFYPIIDSFITSGYKWNGISANRTFIGLKNWVKLLHDMKFWSAFGNNIKVMILSICIQIPLGLALATFLDFAKKKLTIFKVLWFIPLLMSSVAIGFLFNYALATDGGIISAISHLFGGGNIDLLGNPKTALYTVIGVIAWQFTPFYMVYSMAAYTNISTDLSEASTIDGANKWQYFKNVALPLLAPSLQSAAILSMVGSLKYFDLVYVMTGGGPGDSTELMATYMYKYSFAKFNMGYGATVASGMFILITLLSLGTMQFMNFLSKRREED